MVIRPTRTPLPSSIVLSAAVEPCRISDTASAPKSAARSRVMLLHDRRQARAGSDGYLRTATSAPASSSNAVTSVNVPPTSIPIRNFMTLHILPRERGGKRGGARSCAVASVSTLRSRIERDAVIVARRVARDIAAHARRRGPARQRVRADRPSRRRRRIPCVSTSPFLSRRPATLEVSGRRSRAFRIKRRPPTARAGLAPKIPGEENLNRSVRRLMTDSSPRMRHCRRTPRPPRKVPGPPESCASS